MKKTALALLLVLACGRAAEQDPLERLRKSAVDPKELAAPCDLIWTARPVAMSAKKDGDLLRMMLKFWFGGVNAPPPSQLRAALSNVYSPANDREAASLTFMMFDFLSEGEAGSREKELARKYPSDEYRFYRKGSLLMVMSYVAPVEEACADNAWAATLARLADN